MTTPPTLMVCLQCGSTLRNEEGCKIPNPAAAELAETLRDALADTPVQVKLVRCFTHCADPIAWALRAEDKFNFTFAPAGPVEDIVSVTRAWLAADHNGRVQKKDMPDTIRRTVKSRIPPIPKD